jgi:hypothetical protein
MIKFFRKIRQNILSEGKTAKYLKYAFGEITLVVIGILIALQINNWNENRKDGLQEISILKSLQRDLRLDIKNIESELEFKKGMLNDYSNCLNILANKKEGTKSEFIKSFETIFAVGGIELNTTTYNNLQNNGEIKLIRSKTLADSIVSYYNTAYNNWLSSLRDYTRNKIAPYLLQYDYSPQREFENLDKELQNYIDAFPDNKEFGSPERPLEDYKNNYFIINILKFKSRNLVGVIREYNLLLSYANDLDRSIQNHLNSQ